MGVATALWAPAAGAENWEKTFDLEGTPNLRVVSDQGTVRISTWKRAAIRARVEARGWRIGPRDLRCSAELVDGLLRVEVLLPRWGYSPEWTRRSIEVVIHMPDSGLVDIQTEDADIHVPRMRGQFNLRTWNGLIGTDGLSGLVQMRTGNGAIRARNTLGSFSAESSDGPIEVGGRFSHLKIETRDGDVSVRVGERSRLDEPWTIETADGHVWIELPDDLALDFEATSRKGRVEFGERRVRSQRAHPARMLGGLLGGGPKLEITSASGDIHIEADPPPNE